MAKTILIAPGHAGVGLVAVTIGLYQACMAHGVRVGVIQVTQEAEDAARLNKLFPRPAAADFILNAEQLQQAISNKKIDDLLTAILSYRQSLADEYDILLIKGVGYSAGRDVAENINQQIARTLSSSVILLTTLKDPKQIDAQITQELRHFGGVEKANCMGVIFNKVGSPYSGGTQKIDLSSVAVDVGQQELLEEQIKASTFFKKNPQLLLGMIPWTRNFYAPRTLDIANFLQADVIQKGDIETKRVHRAKLCARMVHHVVHVMQPETLLVTAGDRGDILLAAAVATIKGINLSGLVMTGRYQLDQSMIDFCNDAFVAGLPLLCVETDSYETVSRLRDFDFKINADDEVRLEVIRDMAIENIAIDKIISAAQVNLSSQLSPAAFQYQLLSQAKKQLQRIVLPEGEEPRTIQAAISCAKQGLAKVVLLGDDEIINKTAQRFGLQLNDNVEIINAEQIREKYVAPLVDARKHKGVTEVVAREYLQSNIMLATMMLQQGDVDGLVSGAIHTTAHTIRPALQIIKTAPEFSLVSSLFFMCLPEQVLVFADCAINPDPNAKQLAEIAIQTADTAASFGIIPRVAMLSYSTGTSGAGADVDKVQQATDMVKKLRPDLIVDGPLQYDAAIIESVASQKAPHSAVAGKATVLIFPDLNTGNTTYKAVQRSADIISVGPLLQGLNKPVNDLSRGASVRDMIYTIAITAIQSQK